MKENEVLVNKTNVHCALFDSQNNNKGGYCWGPPMTFYVGSLLQVEWTNQHGCGVGHPNMDCEIILQYMCDPSIRDGTVTDTITAATVNTMDTDPTTGNQVYKYGMHEPLGWYQKCASRLRNVGLFTADQNLSPNGPATETRQNPNPNDVHGFECQEERDYYPYWVASPWRDIAILTSNTARCSYYLAETQNKKGRFECTNPYYNNQNACHTNGTWIYVNPWNIPAPECIPAPYTRDNHLGNTVTAMTPTYNWIIPSLDQLGTLNADGASATCVLRIRYNMTDGGDYEAWGVPNQDGTTTFADSTMNNDNSPVRQDPYVAYGTNSAGQPDYFHLALNTDQTGRTFQDRSHTFFIAARPSGVPATSKIINLNVRGKRGNIVETFPATEYDFTPNHLIVNVGDYVHFQWTGCYTNPNYAGNGLSGTDRSNMVQMVSRRNNYPMDFNSQTMFQTPGKAYEMAHLNQYGGAVCQTTTQQSCCKTLTMLQTEGNSEQDPQNCAKLNAPVPYFDGGVQRMTTAGTYYYFGTRNNDFSNRSQKGTLQVTTIVSTWGVALVSIGGAGFVTASGLAGAGYYAMTHPQSALANLFGRLPV